MNILTAVDRGKLAEVESILARDPSQVHVRGVGADQPLHYAAIQGRLKIAEALIASGADLNARGHIGKAPLHHAIENRTKKIRKLLIVKGANVDCEDDLGLTPLFWVAKVGDLESRDVLLRAGATKDLMSMIHIDGPGAVLLVLRENPQVLSGIARPGNVLVEAIDVQSLELVEFLLEHGIDANASNWGLLTPLHRAILKPDNSRIVRLLLDHGADVNARDGIGNKFRQFCTMYRAPESSVRVLREYSGDNW